MIGHAHPLPLFSKFWVGPEILRTDRGLDASARWALHWERRDV